MQVATGTVVARQIALGDDTNLPADAVVTVSARECDETFEVRAGLQAEFEAWYAETERGESISADSFERLRRIA